MDILGFVITFMLSMFLICLIAGGLILWGFSRIERYWLDSEDEKDTFAGREVPGPRA